MVMKFLGEGWAIGDKMSTKVPGVGGGSGGRDHENKAEKACPGSRLPSLPPGPGSGLFPDLLASSLASLHCPPATREVRLEHGLVSVP